MWGVPAVCRFRQVLFGDRLTGKEKKAHGKVKSGISGVVRVWVCYSWVARMMRALGDSEEARDLYIEGGEQVWHIQCVWSECETVN